METIENKKGQQYSKKTYPRTHYEDMWSPYEKCKDIMKHEWKEVNCSNRRNPIESFTRKSKESLAELKLWSNMKFKGRENKLKKLIENLRALKERFNHYKQGDEIKMAEH